MITDTLMRLGTWDLMLSVDVPHEIANVLEAPELDHIVVTRARIIGNLSDDILPVARYVGVLRDRSSDDTSIQLEGVGLPFWLADEDQRGDIIESPIVFEDETFANALRILLPIAIQEGTLHSVAGTYTHTHFLEDRRAAIDYLCESFEAEWRINNDFTLDAGQADDLFNIEPVAIVARRATGSDMSLRGYDGTLKTGRSARELTKRIIVVGGGQGDQIITGSASAATDGLVDRFGNPVKLAKMVNESETDSQLSADTRAALLLNLYKNARQSLELSANDYDIIGELNPGDWIWAYDPEIGLYDPANEREYQGQVIHPVKLRLLEIQTPIEADSGVYLRHRDGVWLDLSPYVLWEDGDPSVTIGEVSWRTSKSDEAITGRVNQSPTGDDGTIPGIPVFGPFQSANYLDDEGVTRSQISANWSKPLNTDGSTITDGSHYELRWRPIALVGE